MDVWLRTNPRPFLAALLLPGLMLLIAAGSVAWGLITGASLWWVTVGASLALAALVVGGLLVVRSRLPVLARQGDKLLLYLDGSAPIAIPIQVVECFFVGQGDMRISDRAGHKLEASTVILRIAEAANEWKHRDVPPRLAHWCEGYITIQGAWCEPIVPELVTGLNKKLVASHRAMKAGHS